MAELATDVKVESEQDTTAQDSSTELKVEEKQDEKRGPDGWIPKVRFKEVIDDRNAAQTALEQEREQRIRLEERLKAQDTARVEADKKAPTTRELDEMVSRGDLTAIQATEYLTKQSEDRAVARALAVAERKSETDRRTQRRESEMRTYAEASPDIMKRGSDVWNKAAEAYQDIVFYNGEPTSVEQKLNYELMAVRTTLGSVSALKARKDADTESRANRETYNEVGNGTQVKTDSEDAKISKLTPAQQEYFHRMVNAGRYPGGAKEYLEELNYKRPRV